MGGGGGRGRAHGSINKNKKLICIDSFLIGLNELKGVSENEDPTWRGVGENDELHDLSTFKELFKWVFQGPAHSKNVF